MRPTHCAALAACVLLAAGGISRAASAQGPAVVTSDSAIAIVADSLVPEALAWANGRIYVGSIAQRRIFAVGTQGRTRTLTPWSPPLGGPVLGLEADSTRGVLWAALMAPAGRGSGALVALSLRDGSVQRMIAAPPGSHLLNDLALAGDGTMYATDSEAGVVWRLVPGADTLAIAIPAYPGWTYANGIALSNGDSLLYVAYDEGIRVGSPRSGRLDALRAAPGTPLGGIDGMYHSAGALIAVQHHDSADQVVRIPLIDGGLAAGTPEVLERRHPLHAAPTTGMLVGHDFVYVANSQLGAWNTHRPIADTTYLLYLPLRSAGGDDARAILERYVQAWRGREEMELRDTVVLGVEVRGTGGGRFTVTLAPDGRATLADGGEQAIEPAFVTDIATLRRLDRDEISAMTAMARARRTDPAPLDVRMPKNFRWTPATQALYLPLTFHFWNRGWPEVIRFGSNTGRTVHGGTSAIFYYDRGLRTSWYRVAPGKHINADPGDQANPFSSLVIVTRGVLQARLGGVERTLREGEAVFVPAGMRHELWAADDQAGEFVLVMFGEGA